MTFPEIARAVRGLPLRRARPGRRGGGPRRGGAAVLLAAPEAWAHPQPGRRAARERGAPGYLLRVRPARPGGVRPARSPPPRAKGAAARGAPHRGADPLLGSHRRPGRGDVRAGRPDAPGGNRRQEGGCALPRRALAPLGEGAHGAGGGLRRGGMDRAEGLTVGLRRRCTSRSTTERSWSTCGAWGPASRTPSSMPRCRGSRTLEVGRVPVHHGPGCRRGRATTGCGPSWWSR